MYAHTNYLSLDIHRETDLFLVVLAFINIFYLSSVIHPDGLYYYTCICIFTQLMCACRRAVVWLSSQLSHTHLLCAGVHLSRIIWIIVPYVQAGQPNKPQ